MIQKKQIFKFSQLAFTFVFLFSSCATNPKSENSLHPSSPAVYDAETTQEISVGQEIHNQILSSFYVYTDRKVVDYVTRVGRKVTESSDRKLPYQFTILYNEKIYATSAPGGFVYVTTGMMNFLKNEAELAAVLAHEVGELQYRDPRFSEFKKAMEQITRTGTTIGPAFGQFGVLAVLGLTMINAAMDTRAKSPEERLLEADRLALQYLLRAGYDPQALLDVQYLFLSSESKAMPYFSDYYKARPVSKDRMFALRDEFARLSLGNRDLITNYREYQQKVKGIKEIYRI